MLQLLLDEQISPAVAEGLRKRHKGLDVIGLAEWDGGRLMGLSDTRLLEEAAANSLTLVTHDCRTVPPLLKVWAESGREHAGAIFVHQKTIPSSDFGGLIHSLAQLHQQARNWDWRDRIVFLRR